MKVRVEKEEDYKITENLTREAFWNLYCEGANEHLILHNIRKSPDFIPELSLVVEENGQILGHILYSHSKIFYEDGAEVPVVTFGPVSVLPVNQNKGIGSFLIKQSLKKAKQIGFKAVIILGYPDLYTRFGFKCSKNYNIKSGDGKYYIGMMVLQLVEGYLPKNIEGTLKYSEQFETDIQELEEFDKLFPLKQKFKTKSQQAFQYVSSKLWNEPYQLNVQDLRNTQKISQN